MDPATLLKRYREMGYNILTPSITLEGLSDHHRATVETILLSSYRDDRDTYPHSSNKTGDKSEYRISKQGLDKLAVLAGLEIATEEKKNTREYVSYRAWGSIQKADGQLVRMTASYDLDLTVIKDEIQNQYEKKARENNKSDDYVRFCVNRDYGQKVKHRATLCESGARNRVIRSLLGLKNVYTHAELSKPFVCVRITYQPDYNDPEVKRLITLAKIGAMGSAYGMLPPVTPAAAAQIEYTEADHGDDGQDDEIIDTEPNGVDTEADELPPDEFKYWDRKSKEIHINQLAKTKKYDLNVMFRKMENVNSLAELNDKQLNKLFGSLSALEDDDIPF